MRNKKSTLYYARMSSRGYGQYCGFARALELVGERWGLMIVRDLFTGPKRFTDLQRGLPKIPSNILTARLKELEQSGVVERVTQAQPRGVFYRLTRDGLELEESMIALSRWGAKRLGELREGEIITPESMTMAFRTTFRPEEAGGVDAAFELHFGPIVLHAIVKNGTADIGKGPIDAPDLVISAGPTFRRVMAGELTPKAAIDQGVCTIEGKRALFYRFARLFRI